jgi:hypothetical protein
LKSLILGFILQAGLLDSPEKSFFLPIYANAMARASLRSRPTCVPHPGHGVDPRILNYLDIDATVDNTFPADCSDSKRSSRSGEIFERCSNDSMSPSS